MIPSSRGALSGSSLLEPWQRWRVSSVFEEIDSASSEMMTEVARRAIKDDFHEETAPRPG